MAEAEQETLEDAMTTNQERHYMDVAADCKVSSKALQQVLEDIELESRTEGEAGTPGGSNTFELLQSSSIHRLGLGVHDLTLFVS